jgi:hypothetical protein
MIAVAERTSKDGWEAIVAQPGAGDLFGKGCLAAQLGGIMPA